MTEISLCSNCFQDQGLRLDAEKIGIINESACTNCGATTGRKLDRQVLKLLADRFFVWGTTIRLKYGAAPVIQFNQHQSTSISGPSWLMADANLIGQALGVGFFYYGPRLWMVGEVEPLKSLQKSKERDLIIRRILNEYPTHVMSDEQIFYRIRKNPKNAEDIGEYDSQPLSRAGKGRLDSKGLSVMYGSQDIQICIHECRVTAEDEVYMATLKPNRELKLIDLTEMLREENITEFESLDLAILMVFLAGSYSYKISREIASSAHAAGYDGLIYPSYFSLLGTGGRPFETVYGLSIRRIPHFHDFEMSKTIPNLAIFGRPVEQGTVTVHCINKVVLTRVDYSFLFGPVGH